MSRPPVAMIASAALVLIATTAGCASPPTGGGEAGVDDPLVASGVDRDATLAAFSVCHGYGCAALHLIGLSPAQQRQLRALFDPPPSSASEERDRIAHAIAYLEKVTGERLGTSADRARTPYTGGDLDQLDCVDESINTSTYLHMLKQAGLLRWHGVSAPARRYRFLNFGVHYTAVILEQVSIATDTAYAVDAWFHPNGAAPEIVELGRWRRGWMPGD
ncbi:MAG: hypothetical protein KDE68_03900 [Rhodocyclaceae bacterium]|nr:hypothetical protein [Rhodocyclaceae bacterium]